MLNEKHLNELLDSGIDEQTATDCGLFTETSSMNIAKYLNWKKEKQSSAAALVFPYFSHGVISSKPIVYRMKLDSPRKNSDGKTIKYEQPRGVQSPIYIPPIIDQDKLSDRRIPLIFTEGEKKAISANKHGFLCISAPGVWSFHDPKKSDTSKNFYVAKTSLSELPLRDRVCHICFDADKVSNLNVLRAELALAKILYGFGSTVRLINLPEEV